VIHRNSKGIIERRRVVDIQGHDSIGTRGLQELGHVAGIDRIAQLGAPFLAGKGQIGDECHTLARAGITQRIEQEQKS
jgi:hypothetical protein